MKKFFILVFFSTLLASIAKAADGDIKVELDPYTFIHVGNYEISGVDEGDYSGFGIGVRVGVRAPWLWLGIDGNVVKPSFKSTSSGVIDRDAHPLADGQNFTSLGAGASLILGAVRLNYTYFLEQNVAVDITDGAASSEYKYFGKGWKAGADLEIANGLHFFVEKFVSNLDQYENSRTVGTVPATTRKTNRTSFDIDSWSVGIGFKLRFGSLGSFY